MNDREYQLIIFPYDGNTMRADINLECVMSAACTVRRRPDGSIDIDHYRRTATRQRAAALRHMHRRLAAGISRIVATFGTRSPRKLPPPRLATR
jgi:hypothetical protein